MLQRSLFTSTSDEWETPEWLFAALSKEFAFTLDPCASDQNAKCGYYFSKQDDGLIQDWSEQTVFMNPPYGRTIGQWMQKAYESSRQGATVVCLVPARTDTTWWHRYAMHGEIRFLRGRVRFVGGRHCAPFPSAIVVFRSARYKVMAVDLTAGDP